METRKTIRKWVWVWDFDKEEAWLNDMAQSGWVLESVGFCRYTFVKCEPGEYSVRMEMHSFDEEFLRFMQDTGAEYIGRMVMWIYFRKKTAEGSFDLFSDMDSRIRHLDGICKVLTIAGVGNLLIGLANNPARMGWINLLCATLVMYALGRIQGKKEALEKERMLHE